MPLLKQLHSGIMDDELPVALEGLGYGSSQVRAAALAALPSCPMLAEGVCPEDVGVAAALWVARHDVSEANAEAAARLWEMVSHVGRWDLRDGRRHGRRRGRWEVLPALLLLHHMNCL